MNGGEGGIRTPGPLRVNDFQDRRFRPLSHLSETWFCIGTGCPEIRFEKDTESATLDQPMSNPVRLQTCHRNEILGWDDIQ